MEGVSIVSTTLLESMLSKIDDLHAQVSQMNAERKAQSAPYLTTAQVCKYINKSRNWVMTHKHHLGCSKRAGTLLFKRADIDEFINSDYFKK
jgi:hypothetical protein